MINIDIKQPSINKIKISPIFIVGCDRSGTTLLRLMLNQSPILHIFPETKFLAPLQRNNSVYGDFTQPEQRYFFIRDLQTNEATSKTFTFPILDLTVREAEKAIAQSTPTNFAGAAHALFTASAAKKQKIRWGDKTPHQIQDISLLAKTFPNAQFVHMIRDARDVAVSIRKAGWLNGNILAIAQYWQQQVQAGINAGKALENSESRYYELYYEQLLQQPEKTLKDLCVWLHLDYTPKMLKYYENSSSDIQPEHKSLFALNHQPIDYSRVYSWKSQANIADIADIESVAGNLIQALGYELSGAKISFWIKLNRYLINHFTPFLYLLKRKLKT